MRWAVLTGVLLGGAAGPVLPALPGSSPPAAGVPARVPVHAPALRFGRLQLAPCQIGGHEADGLATISAYCTAFPVPEDWRAPAGRRIALRVAIVTAAAATPDADVVAFLDGGPGGAATDDYPAIAGAFEPLRARHDILLVDQRGTGGSNPLNCPQLQHAAQMPSAPAHTDQHEAHQHDAHPGEAYHGEAYQDEAQTAAALQQMLRDCLAQLAPRAAPQFYTTSDAVRDLEAVRAALGSPQLDLVGISYGTRVAQQYARRYPAAVRSVVLDSPVPNRLALLSEHARNLEHALQLLFGRCRADSACAQRFGDPYATLYRVRARLQAHPQPVQLRDPVSFQPLSLTLTADDLAAVVRFYAYNGLTAALLPLMLQQADAGNYAPLLGQKKWLADDLDGQITGGVELSVLCAEDVDLLAPRPADANTLLGNGVIRRAQSACQVWPRGRRPTDFHAPWVSSLPVLVLGGEFDPVTPPAYGAEIVRTLSHARLLVARGQGHGVIGAGCLPRLVARFVDTLRPAVLDASCLRRLGDTPAFIDYNGAAP